MQITDGPLNDISVIEFGSFIAGPFAGQILADMGADVIKVEPLSGDPWRTSGRLIENEGRGFLTLNRGTRSLSIDLKNPDKTFSDLMGDDVEPRRNFILKKAQFATNLDI